MDVEADAVPERVREQLGEAVLGEDPAGAPIEAFEDDQLVEELVEVGLAREQRVAGELRARGRGRVVAAAGGSARMNGRDGERTDDRERRP